MEEDREDEHPVRNLVLSVCDLKQHGEVPAARCGSQTVVMATRMYLHGGCDEKQTYGDLHLLEIEHMNWTELITEGAVPVPRWGHTLEAYDTDLVLFGGLIPEEQGLLDDGARASGPVAPPFAPGLAWGHRGVTDNSLYTLQTTSLTWKVAECVGTPPSPRFYHSAVVANDLYVIFGGCESADFAEPLDDIHWLDFRSMQWNSPEVSGSPPPARFGQKMIHGPQDQIFVFGGSGGPDGPEVSPATLWGFKISTAVWTQVQVAGTAPLERVFHSFDLIGKWGFAFAGSTSTSVSDLYILDVNNMRWARPLYEGQLNVRAHASTVLHDKLIIFGGVRDKVSEKKRGPPEIEARISRKLFFLNVLEVRSSVAEGDYKFKLVTIGDSGVGKSCLLTRFVQDFYSDFHVSTIGVDFKTVITMVKGKLVKLQLWDTAGQERFSVVTGNYYRNSDGFIFVYDATNRASFDHVEQWMSQVLQHHECGPTTIKMLVGNKTDMAGEVVVTPEEAKAKAAEIGAIYVATSAKTASNVDMVFLTAAQKLVDTRKRQQEQSKNTVKIGAPSQRTPGAGQGEGKKCCAGGGGGGLAMPRR